MREKKTGGWGRAASFVFRVLLTAAPVLIFYYTYQRYYEKATYYDRGNYVFALLYLFLLALFLGMYGGYRVRSSRTRELVFSFAIASLLTNGIIYFVMSLIARELLNPLYECGAMAVQWVVETILYIFIRITDPKINPDIPALYVRGPGQADRALAGKFSSLRTRYTVRETLDGDEPWPLLLAAVRRYEAVLLGGVPEDLRRRVADVCFREDKTLMLAPTMMDIMLAGAERIVMEDTLLYVLNTDRVDPAYRAVKRGLDVLVSALGLLILSPLLGVLALCVHLYDGGPVFYRQVRLTEGGREFRLIKFRSMIVDAESRTGAVLAGKTDGRITPVGRFLRAARLDELPQLWNILRGDMTLVGPRPERPEFYEKYCAEYPEFSYRLKVKAGLTGYAQLYGKYNTTFADKARMDMYYIQRASLLWDLQLILYTLKILFIRESTEGVSAGEDEEKQEALSGK